MSRACLRDESRAMTLSTSRRHLRTSAPLSFRPSRAIQRARLGMGRAPHHWRIVTTESNAPMAPAASLLFQAPVFQAAPEVASPAAFEEPETKPKRRRGSSDDEASASQEETTPKRRRRSKKSVDEASAPTAEPAKQAFTPAPEAPTKNGQPRIAPLSSDVERTVIARVPPRDSYPLIVQSSPTTKPTPVVTPAPKDEYTSAVVTPPPPTRSRARPPRRRSPRPRCR